MENRVLDLNHGSGPGASGRGFQPLLPSFPWGGRGTWMPEMLQVNQPDMGIYELSLVPLQYSGRAAYPSNFEQAVCSPRYYCGRSPAPKEPWNDATSNGFSHGFISCRVLSTHTSGVRASGLRAQAAAWRQCWAKKATQSYRLVESDLVMFQDAWRNPEIAPFGFHGLSASLKPQEITVCW